VAAYGAFWKPWKPTGSQLLAFSVLGGVMSLKMFKLGVGHSTRDAQDTQCDVALALAYCFGHIRRKFACSSLSRLSLVMATGVNQADKAFDLVFFLPRTGPQNTSGRTLR
jgi:hypothetical protein